MSTITLPAPAETTVETEIAVRQPSVLERQTLAVLLKARKALEDRGWTDNWVNSEGAVCILGAIGVGLADDPMYIEPLEKVSEWDDVLTQSVVAISDQAPKRFRRNRLDARANALMNYNDNGHHWACGTNARRKRSIESMFDRAIAKLEERVG